jgi:hypothetical protein
VVVHAVVAVTGVTTVGHGHGHGHGDDYDYDHDDGH